MDSVGWLLHGHYIRTEPDGSGIVAALKEMNVPFSIVEWERGSIGTWHWPNKETDIVGALGTIAFIQQFHRQYQGPPLYPFFSSEVHYFSRYQHKVPRDELLNNSGFLLPFSEIRRRPVEQVMGLFGADVVFVRPDQALKIREAECVERRCLTEWIRYGETVLRTDPSVMFWLFEAKSIEKEIRFVVAEGKVVAGSQYLRAGEIAYDATVPDSAWVYARSVVSRIGLEEPVYILDVASCEGQWRVLEINAFSTSSLYRMDKASAMQAASTALRAVALEWTD